MMMRLEMAPCLSVDDMTDGCVADSVPLPKLCLSNVALCEAFSDFQDLGGGQSGVSALVGSVSNDPVVGVVLCCAQLPVVRVLAERVVALVPDLQPKWNGPVQLFPAEPVGSNVPLGSSADAEGAVSVVGTSSGPGMAAGRVAGSVDLSFVAHGSGDSTLRHIGSLCGKASVRGGVASTTLSPPEYVKAV